MNPEDPRIPSSQESTLRLIGLAFRLKECEVIARELRGTGGASVRPGCGVLTLGDLAEGTISSSRCISLRQPVALHIRSVWSRDDRPRSDSMQRLAESQDGQ